MTEGLTAATTLAPIGLLLIVVATAAWVYQDAVAQCERGSPVVASLGSIRVDTPAAWCIGCLAAWVLFFPLYLAARGRDGA